MAKASTPTPDETTPDPETPDPENTPQEDAETPEAQTPPEDPTPLFTETLEAQDKGYIGETAADRAKDQG